VWADFQDVAARLWNFRLAPILDRALQLETFNLQLPLLLFPQNPPNLSYTCHKKAI
jgi:hypothetical protein